MDVSLVLTHRCNFRCGYCYAGASLPKDMDDATLERGVGLLFADGAKEAQLSFFGGEPFLALEKMEHAIALAEAEAERCEARLTLQCTTNGSLLGPKALRLVADSGMALTVSIDGVREAHEAHRPLASGGSSYDGVLGGLRAATAAGVEPDAMMVITPTSAPRVFASVCALWDEGVRVVHANLELSQLWTDDDRRALREQLLEVGREQLRRELAAMAGTGAPALFEPFEVGMRAHRESTAALLAGEAEPESKGCVQGHQGAKRLQVVVAASGRLYPCGPMVGEDRDDGPGAALRLGHIADEPEVIIAAVTAQGACCADGDACACAAYLETGDRATGGPNGLWYGRICEQIGRATAAGLDEAAVRAALDDDARDLPRAKRGRGLLFLGAGLGVASLAGGGWMLATGGRPFRTAGDIAPARPPKPPTHERRTMGKVSPTQLPPQPAVKGDMATPPRAEPTDADKRPPKIQVRGKMRRPPVPRISGKVRIPERRTDDAIKPKKRKPAQLKPVKHKTKRQRSKPILRRRSKK